MIHIPLPRRKTIAALLAGQVFLSQGLLGYAVETNFWKERGQQARSVSVPPIQLTALPAVASALMGRGQNSFSLSAVIPGSCATVQRVIPAVDAKAPTVVLIQDVHENLEAQTNIGKTVNALMEAHRAGILALEGVWGPVLIERLRHPAHRVAVGRIADYLLAKKEISGPIHAALTTPAPAPAVIGIDDAILYQANVDAYRGAAAREAEVKSSLKTQTRRLSEEKRVLFNKRLADFNRLVEANQSGMLPLAAYLQELSDLLGASVFTPALLEFQEALRLESSMDFKRVEVERAQLLERLTNHLKPAELQSLVDAGVSYRMGQITHGAFYGRLEELCRKSGLPVHRYPALQNYFRYSHLAEQVDMERLTADLRALEEQTYSARAQSPEEKRLVAESKLACLTRKLIDFSLTREEWSDYKSLPKTELALAPFESFYREAEARDAAMAANIISSVKKSGSRSAVVVAGGFHSGGLMKRMSAAGFSVMLVRPRLTHVGPESGSAYLTAFAQEKTPLDKLFEGEKLFLPKPPFPERVATGDLPAGAALLEGRSQTYSDLAPAGRGEPVNVGPEAIDYPVGNKIVKTTLQLKPDGAIQELDSKLVEEITPTLLANLFSGKLGLGGWLTPLNWVIRVIFIGAILPHEVGHLIAGPSVGHRFDRKFLGIFKGLFRGMPWRTRGPRILAGLAANVFILVIIFSIDCFHDVHMTLDFAQAPVDSFLTYFRTVNQLLMASEIFLTPFARQLGISRTPDLLRFHGATSVPTPLKRNVARKKYTGFSVQPNLNLTKLEMAEARGAFEMLRDLRPGMGWVHIVENLPPLPLYTKQFPNKFYTWRTDGSIFIQRSYLTWLAEHTRSPDDFVVPPGENPVVRGVALAILAASYQYQKWNRLFVPFTKDFFRAWKKEADDAFSMTNPTPTRELVDSFEQEFTSPETMAVTQIREAATSLHLSPKETRDLVEPIHIFRFEIPIVMDNGEKKRFIAWRVHHDDTLGPNKGGFRFVEKMDEAMVSDLAREMTIKTAVTGLPLGGGKGGVRVDASKLSRRELALITRGYVRRLYAENAIGPWTDIPAPDMFTNAEIMAWFLDEYIRLQVKTQELSDQELSNIYNGEQDVTATRYADTYMQLLDRKEVDGTDLGVVTGKPLRLGGIFGREKSTALGVEYVGGEAILTYFHSDEGFRGRRVAIQGSGNVGSNTALILAEEGAIITAISEQYGTAINPNGIDIPALMAFYAANKTFKGFNQKGTTIDSGPTAGNGALYADAEILIPAALEKQIHADNVQHIHPNVKLILEAANGPTTPEAASWLSRNRPEVTIIPDVLVNAGGVTVSYFESQRNLGELPQNITIEQVRELLRERMVPAARNLFRVAAQRKITPRQAAFVVPVQDIHSASGNGHGQALIEKLRKTVRSVFRNGVKVIGAYSFLFVIPFVFLLINPLFAGWDRERRNGIERRLAHLVVEQLAVGSQSEEGRLAAARVLNEIGQTLPPENRGLSNADRTLALPTAAIDGATFDMDLFKQELRQRILSNPRITAQGARVVRNQALQLLAPIDLGTNFQQELANVPEGGLLIVALDASLPSERRRELLSGFLASRAPQSGKEILFLAESAGIASEIQAVIEAQPLDHRGGLHIETRAAPITHSPDGVPTLSLLSLDSLLRSPAYLGRFTKVRFVASDRLQLSTEGLGAGSPLRQALFTLINQELQSRTIGFNRIDTIDWIGRSVSSQA